MILKARDIQFRWDYFIRACCYCSMKSAEHEVYYSSKYEERAPKKCHLLWCYACDDCAIKLGVVW